jgi:E3 ubiquitin-protein ligase TRIP12
MDPSDQFMAVQELNELLAMSTEDTLGPGSGTGFRPEAFVTELVGILSGANNPLGVDNPELQLLACRCIANLIEALPTPNTFYAIISSGAIPVLCGKLMMIEYIDVAEQAIATLERISRENPRDVLKEGGLNAMLSFLDFFNINVQRTAVACAANLLQKVPRDLFGACRDSLATLSNLLSYSDAKIVDSACIAVNRFVESFAVSTERAKRSSSTEKIEAVLDQVVTPSLLENLIRAMLTASSAAGGSSVSPSTLLIVVKTLCLLASDSSALAHQIMQLDIAESIASIFGSTKMADSTMGAGVNSRTSEQVVHLMEFIVALLPSTPIDEKIGDGKRLLKSVSFKDPSARRDLSAPAESLVFPVPDVEIASGDAVANRMDLVKYCAVILPLVVEIYQSTVNSSVRIKCLIALTRGIFWLDSNELTTVLPDVPLASFLARILGRSFPAAVAFLSPSAQSTVSSTKQSDDQMNIDEPVAETSAAPLIPRSETALRPRQQVSNTTLLTILSYTIYLCDLVMLKLAGHYHVFFRREGIPSFLEIDINE